MAHFKRSSVFLLPLLLSSCASIMDGTSQDIEFDSTPSGAVCEVLRGPDVVANITTPATVRVVKTRGDLTVRCSHIGYAPTTVNVVSQTSAYAIGNGGFGLLAPVTYGIDAARGADNKYDEKVIVVLKAQ